VRDVHTVAAVREAEEALMARLPEGALMQRAATALATQCAGVLGKVYGSRVVLLVGGGNNGGDALYAGAWLARRGARVTALLIDPDRAHAGGLVALDAAGGRSALADPSLVPGADLVVDGITGLGGHPGLRGLAKDMVAAVDSVVVSVDLPSGVHADTGAADDTAVRADLTVTFGALKTGLLVGPGADLAGEVRLIDIGLGPDLPEARARVLEAGDVAAVLPQPGADDDKYTRGVVGVVAGSPEYRGAGVLATGAALVGGAGMVRYLGRAPEQIRDRYPEVVVHDASRPREVRVQAWVVGPGLGTDNVAQALVAEVLRSDLPVIVDADAITLVARAPGLVHGRRAPTVLTPHDREFARLAGEPGADRLSAVRRAAAEFGATVLLKGNATIVADPDGLAYLNPTGTPWLATAGSGDVLSGLIGSLLASGLPATLATAVAAYLHGVAGQQAAAAGPATSADILAALPRAIRTVTAGS
jgi:hydroxyethylthiazole kinase-like uncharacterized protein yjeF